ncbi:MAG: MarR family transcriptional regulator [Ilumatobacteraceae bacterium]
MPSDQIDQIVQQWREHVTALVDPGPLAVTGRILQIARHLERARLKVLTAWGLTLADFDVLATLSRTAHDRSLNARELLGETMVTSGAMTTRLDRLEALACIRRDPDPADRRGVLISLTETGKVMVEQAFAAVMASEASLLTALGTTERKRLESVLRSLVVACRAGSPRS